MSHPGRAAEGKIGRANNVNPRLMPRYPGPRKVGAGPGCRAWPVRTGKRRPDRSSSAVRSCWAVGGYGKANGATVNQALYWNGRKWSLTRTSNPAGTGPADNNLLYNVSCASLKTCWAVGADFGYSGPVVAEALRWDRDSMVCCAHTPAPPSGSRRCLFTDWHQLPCATRVLGCRRLHQRPARRQPDLALERHEVVGGSRSQSWRVSEFCCQRPVRRDMCFDPELLGCRWVQRAAAPESWP